VPQWAVSIGAALILFGIAVTVASESGSGTSLIPTFIGLVLAGLGVIAGTWPRTRKQAMRAASVLALAAIVASVASAITRESDGWALGSQIVTAGLCLVFLVLAVMSFTAEQVDPNRASRSRR
jgi:peptidoglycan/LPS O-acetylase OafA/YrhL